MSWWLRAKGLMPYAYSTMQCVPAFLSPPFTLHNVVNTCKINIQRQVIYAKFPLKKRKELRNEKTDEWGESEMDFRETRMTRGAVLDGL